jgi:hypothetical protein
MHIITTQVEREKNAGFMILLQENQIQDFQLQINASHKRLKDLSR